MKVQPVLQKIVESLNSIKKKQDKDSTRLTKIAHDVGGLTKDVGGIKKEVGGLKQDMSSLKKTVASIEKEQKEDSIRLTVLQVDISEMRATNDRTEEKVDKTLTQLNNLVVTKVLTYDAEHAAHRHAQAPHEGRITALEAKKQKQSS